MPGSLAELETRRAAMQSQFVELGDMRSGSITGTGGRCGNPRCHCHRSGDSGRGPYYRRPRKVEGKTIREAFTSPAELAKARREVAEYHCFRELGRRLLEVNEAICRLRPVEEPSSRARKKTGGNDPPGSGARSRPTPGRLFSRSAARRGVWIWTPWRWRCARPCIGPERRRSANCCNSRYPPPISGAFLALALKRLTIGRCAPSRSSPPWARWRCRVPTLCALAVTLANSPLIENWISRTRPSLPECGVCRRG